MKHGNNYYIQLGRDVFNEYDYQELPMYSRWIFTVLNELEHKYTGKNEDFFFRSNELLAEDCGLSIKTIKRYKKYLIDLGFIESWHMHFRNTESGKLSEKKVCAYRILK